MKVIQSGTKYRLFDDSIQSHDVLPIATYNVNYNQQDGCFLVETQNLNVVEKAYGVHTEKVKKVFETFNAFNRSLGVILSGDKGIGKSMFAKMVCMESISRGIPVIIVDTCYPAIARFISSIRQECVIVFDEFDKMFRCNHDVDEQAALLTMFDGISDGKKLYIVTCNELHGLNSYIVNRPGRFHYHFRFDYPSAEDIREYLKDKLKYPYYGQISKVVEFSKKVSLNYDCLRAIAFELNSGNTFAEAISDLNILVTEQEKYTVRLFLKNGTCYYNTCHYSNLYAFDGTMTQIHLYDDNGKYVFSAYYDKSFVRYDMSKGVVIVPNNGIKIVENNDDCDEVISINCGKSDVLYMTFTKHTTSNLHYRI